MSPENFNPFKKEKNRYLSEKEKEKQRKKKENGDFNPSRREFLKKAGVAAGGFMLSGSLGKIFWDKIKEEDDIEQKNATTETKKASPPPEQPTPEQEKIEKENITSLAEVLDYDKEGRIELNEETMEAIKNHWKERYKEEPDLRDSLIEGYKRMGEWEPYLREQFRQEGVPEKYTYVTLPESHWDIGARSSAGALGPYQFTAYTAKKFGLEINTKNHPSNLDERKDPILAAKACAQHLKEAHDSSGSWDLALAGYNGGYFWEYAKKAYKEGQDISYANFLKYLEDKLNNVKDEIKSKEYEEYKVKKGDTMEDIASEFNMEVEELCRINNIENRGRIFAGQELQIPITENTKKKIFEDKISDMEENLNYPPKFNAVYELIQEGFVKDQKDPISFDTIQVKKGYKRHIFKKEEDNIYRLSQKFPGVSKEEIIKANPHINPHNLGGGEKLYIPTREAEPTLAHIATQQKEDLEQLTKLNPAIENPKRSIPKGYKIRTPTQ